MAKARKIKPFGGMTCKDCINSGIRFENDYQGNPFLTKCKFFKSARFLKSDVCEHFKQGEPVITIIDGEKIKDGKIRLADL